MSTSTNPPCCDKPYDFDANSLYACQINRQVSADYAHQAFAQAAQLSKQNPKSTDAILSTVFAVNLMDPNTDCNKVLSNVNGYIKSIPDDCNRCAFTNMISEANKVVVANQGKMNDFNTTYNFFTCLNFGPNTAQSMGVDCSQYCNMDRLQTALNKRCPAPSK